MDLRRLVTVKREFRQHFLWGVGGRHGYRSKKFPAATYVRDYFINITKKPKKLKKYVIFGNRNWLEV